MINISGSNVSVMVLDPVRDDNYLGSRYCAGGYVWQIYLKGGGDEARPLLSGPQFPSQFPSPFDGQGMPEVFETPLGGGDVDGRVAYCVIGVGLVAKTSPIEPFHPRNNPVVAERCVWSVDRGFDRVVMTTRQTFGERSINLRREVRIGDGDRVESITTVENIGREDIDLRWFSHPFFPPANLTCGKILPGASMRSNAGYEVGEDGVIRMKRDYPWEKGLFQELEVPRDKLCFSIPHSVVGFVELKTDYDAANCALWANDRTFSFEPFMERAVKSFDNVTWSVSLEMR